MDSGIGPFAAASLPIGADGTGGRARGAPRFAFAAGHAPCGRRALARLAPIAAVAALALAPAGAAEPEPGDARLRRDLVRVEAGRLLYEDVSLCTLSAPGGAASRFQVHSRAEAPASETISRDVFVALISRIETELSLSMADAIPGIKPSQALAALECDQLAAPIGQVDLEIRTTVTAEGLQVEIEDTRTGTTSRYANLWKDLRE